MKYSDNRYQFTDKNHFSTFQTSIIPLPMIPSYRSNNPMITIQKIIIMKNDNHPLSQPTNNSPQITKFSCTIISRVSHQNLDFNDNPLQRLSSYINNHLFTRSIRFITIPNSHLHPLPPIINISNDNLPNQETIIESPMITTNYNNHHDSHFVKPITTSRLNFQE